MILATCTVESTEQTARSGFLDPNAPTVAVIDSEADLYHSLRFKQREG